MPPSASGLTLGTKCLPGKATRHCIFGWGLHGARSALGFRAGHKRGLAIYYNPDKFASMRLGIVLRRSPGATRWAKWAWKAVAVLPGASDATWKTLRQDGDVTEFHAATVSLDLHGSDAEAYRHGLSAREPCIYVILRPGDPLDVVLATASPYEAQDYADSGEEIVEKVPMPEGLVAWVRDFALSHYEEEVFKKRKRDRAKTDGQQAGKGDARIPQLADVFRNPASKKDRLH